MEPKNKFNAFLSNAGKAAKNMIDTTLQAADQNDDGKFDLADVSVIAGVVGDSVKKGTQAVKTTAEEKARQLELKTLRPIFTHSLDEANFLMPKFIRITERDKKYAESEVCQDSIGYLSDQKGLLIVNIFRDSLEAFGLSFYPDCDSEFYYVDPSDRDCYIALNDYFNHLKEARVNELLKIAQDLGATHFKVIYKEEQASFTDKKASASSKAVNTSTDASHHSSEKKYSKIEIASDMHFTGHSPTKPQLKYLQNNPSIQNLIAMRLDENSPLQDQQLSIKFSRCSGMKESDAAKIDGILKGMKISGNATLASEVKNEDRRYLEYEIEF